MITNIKNKSWNYYRLKNGLRLIANSQQAQYSN